MKKAGAVKVSYDELHESARLSGISREQAEILWAKLQPKPNETQAPKFDAENVAYYFGALIIIGAMGWFMTNAWDYLDGLGLAIVALAYATLFYLIGARFWNTAHRRVPGGLLLTAAVCMTPLAVYGIERATGFWPVADPGGYSRFHPYVNGSWLVMEASTVLVGLFTLRKWRFPFITAPIAYALWYASMDAPELFFTQPLSGDEKKFFSVAFGLLMLGFTYLADLRRKQEDLTFWGYLFGLLTFWGGLTAMNSSSELGKFIYFLINLGLVATAVILRRRTFILFGALGVCFYLGHLAHDLFKDSFAFPFVLSFIGLGIIYLGILYRRKAEAIHTWIDLHLPPALNNWIPARAKA
ncbi:DUF2157 domain-containing protein [Opitutus sp. ER46]|uniref:DUF2157 domain-containing protein n=1 Tax=Opitutus sp. ER46 TaxID=2161864 RepID=UPI0011B22F46|nr:DUF2157 domain-containing protein [Opitutus sp. ER46]